MVGGQAALARLLTSITGVVVSQQRLCNIHSRGGKVPAELVIPIERATDGRITRHQLRPDLYPIEDTASAIAVHVRARDDVA